MPTDISNALGTARQFTPRPDALYQQRLTGVQALQHAASQFTNHALVAENLGKLTSAMRNFEVNDERRKDEWGLEAATRLINSTSAEDIAKLDVIDAAQQARLLDVKDNPYFKAHAEKLRGEFMSTEARRAYDEKYAELPAESADAEMKRWDEFRTDWVKEKVTTLPLNQVAFDEGFNKNGMVNRTMIGNEYSKKQIEELHVNTAANLRAKLGEINERAPELLKENGALSKEYQDAFNEPRLAGLPPKWRYAEAEKAISDLVKTGRISKERALQMMDAVTIQTGMDGNRSVLSDVIDPFTVGVMAENYQNQFYTEYKHDVIEKYKNDPNMERFYKDAEELRFTDPDKYKSMMQMASHADSQQRSIQKAKATAAQKAAKKDTTYNISKAYLKANYKAYIDGLEFDGSPNANRSGMPLVPDNKGGWRKPNDEEKTDFFKESLDYIMDYNNEPDMSEETRSRYWMKLFNYAPFASIKKSYTDEYEQLLAGITELPLDGNGNPAVPEKIKMFVASYRHDASDFNNAFGTNMSKMTSRLVRYTDSAGSLEGGLQMLATDNALDPELKQKYSHKVSSMIAKSGFNIEGMHTSGGGNTTTVWLGSNELAAQYVEDQASFYKAHGYSTEGAIQMALNEVKKSMMYCHGALLPKTVFNNAGTGNDEYWATQVMNSLIYEVAAASGNVDDAAEVNLAYNARESSFTFSHNNVIKRLYLDDIKQEAYKRAKDAQENNSVPSTLSVEDINAERNPYSIPEDTQAYEGMTLLKNAGMLARPSETFHK